MLEMLRDLVEHKWHSNAALLKAIQAHEKAAQDEELLKLLHHILLANRFWLTLSMQLSFSVAEESVAPESLALLVANYEKTCAQEREWVKQLQETGLERKLETSYIPGYSFSIAEGIMQVCMHSQGHRSQCATMLRRLGGTPPATDFILWLKERPAVDWQSARQ